MNVNDQNLPPDRPVALVTGATKGLGRAIAEVLAPDHHVLIGGRNLKQAQAVASALPSAQPFITDLTDPEATSAAFTQIVAPLGRLDVLVNNAGISARGTVADTTHTQWVEMLMANVVAVADLTRAALPLLRESSGTVIMINSGSGLNPGPGNASYAASKFALKGLTDALREEERGRLRVTSIHPGRIDTSMQERLQAADGRPYSPEEHMDPRDVAATVRLAVDVSSRSCVEQLNVRPVRELSASPRT